VSAPAVSVIIPSYNSAEFLSDALQSVQDQTFPDFECLIVDDGSTDNSAAVAAQFARSDSRFKLVRLDGNHGASVARNAGLESAAGRWITLLDADDLYVSDRLERLTHIGEHAGVDLVIDDLMVTEFPAMRSVQRAFGFRRPQAVFTQEDFFSGSRLFRRALSTGYIQPLMRRDFLRLANAAYDPSVPSGEDFLLYARLFALRPRCLATSYCGYVYRRRRGSLSRSDTHVQVHAQLGERVLEEFGDQLSPKTRQEIAGRRRDLEQLVSAMPAINALRAGKWIQFAKYVATRKGAAVACLRLGQRKAHRLSSACLARLRSR
jgi:succinoglycan biosynthesis protein ExoO